ncbi:hypothetical protein BVJ53_09360 [Lacticaseibacillus chiayiensis]|uniref:Uncharacterized protein n=1 Tax=Lacticaseibacillus chiayiensis TaxID=2100821 RepID=A0A4Q1TSR3_9LACO|nr:hypothetical protein [Lacticaseibacillus chiayiensis]QVI35457.1 hypothetical protein KG086_03935 [Lacticaseibacillus chiayiensis]RXT21327.1 hypothetical protein BVJ53_09360 [Lacticaseibacillus chiayiensis]RXT59429.1 hypothetical protein CHT97_00320 [Lacticaseibacillus chiayiensis]UYN57297.1 hypothetical protein OFW50_04305 [Lacticaseibacillus chiayiensis]
MPFLLIPLMFFIVGLVLVAVFAIGIILLKMLIVPALLVVLAVWLFSRHDRDGRRGPRHPYRDQGAPRPRKNATHVTESHDDDWSDF